MASRPRSIYRERICAVDASVFFPHLECYRFSRSVSVHQCFRPRRFPSSCDIYFRYPTPLPVRGHGVQCSMFNVQVVSCCRETPRIPIVSVCLPSVTDRFCSHVGVSVMMSSVCQCDLPHAHARVSTAKFQCRPSLTRARTGSGPLPQRTHVYAILTRGMI